MAVTPAATATAVPQLLAHQKVLELNNGDAGWMIVATCLVLFMTLPGLALFYGGMVRKKNLLSTLAQSVAVTAVATILWILVGYSLAFGVAPGAANQFIGSFDAVLLKGVTTSTAQPSPSSVIDAARPCTRRTPEVARECTQARYIP